MLHGGQDGEQKEEDIKTQDNDVVEVPPFVEPPQLASVPPRPPCKITTGPSSAGDAHLDVSHAQLPQPLEGVQWQTAATCAAPIDDLASWLRVMETFIRQPEVNTTNILRADILFDERVERGSQASSSDRDRPQWQPVRRLVRRLLPRKPGVNAHLDQLCTFYEDARGSGSGLVVYTPLIAAQTAVDDGLTLDAWLAQQRSPSGPDEIPFYHPPLLALGFAYLRHPSSPSSPPAHLSISILPFPSPTSTSPAPSPLPEKLLRISTTLLTTLHRHQWGQSHSYKTRVTHDVLVPKRLFQDVYLNLKQRWARYLVEEWRESTLAEKHVHEDLALAAWIVCFWKVRFGAAAEGEEKEEGEVEVPLESRPWLTDPAAWPRPKGGFIDVGCGNGLLVWLLNNEGYGGFGFDLRERKSWELFRRSVPAKDGCPASRPAELRVHSLDALEAIWFGYTTTTTTPTTTSSPPSHPLFPPSSFLIGNHADELTPLLPFLATHVVGPSCTGMLNIPCCKWKLDGTRFTGATYRVGSGEVREALGLGLVGEECDDGEVQRRRRIVRDEMREMARGPPVEATVSAASTPSCRLWSYLAYISHLHLLAGWHVEKEALRIPSTRNWAVVGTRRVDADGDGKRRWVERDEKVGGMLREARRLWRARGSEGGSEGDGDGVVEKRVEEMSLQEGEHEEGAAAEEHSEQ